MVDSTKNLHLHIKVTPNPSLAALAKVRHAKPPPRFHDTTSQEGHKPQSVGVAEVVLSACGLAI